MRSGRMDWALTFAGGRARCCWTELVRYGLELYRNLYPVAYIQYYASGDGALFARRLVASWWKNTPRARGLEGTTYEGSARNA